jgi:hypothetical protein
MQKSNIGHLSSCHIWPLKDKKGLREEEGEREKEESKKEKGKKSASHCHMSVPKLAALLAARMGRVKGTPKTI